MSVSISDVAQKAGVSISTVSKALNDKSSVSSSTIVSGMNAAKKILKMEKPPRSILCANSVIAFGMMQEKKNQSVRIPKDMAVMTFDRYPFSDFTEPRATSVDRDV